MKYREFKDYSELASEAVKLLGGYFGKKWKSPHAVMLAGGMTPIGIYDQIAEWPVSVHENLRIILSDERDVPFDSENNNFGKIKPMIDALKILDEHVIAVDTDVALEFSADRYNDRLSSFINEGGVIAFALLGIGSDGHTASLFTRDDIERGEGRYAMAVKRDVQGPDRISVTADCLRMVERVVFIASGPEKKSVVDKLRDAPQTVIAGMATADVADVELWYSHLT